MTTAEKLADNAPLDPDDELLVAYLDGELSRQDQAELEDRLMTDDDLRSRLQQLQTGWDLLDALPDPEPSLKLVESTLEMVVDDIVKRQPSRKSLRRFRYPVLIGLACVLGVGMVAAVASTIRRNHYRQQLNDLAMAEFLDAYSYGADLTLMRQLTANAEWLNMVSAASEIGDIAVMEIANVGETPLEQRDELIRNLPPEKVDQLNSRWERFKRMDESKRDQMRQTAEAVAVQPDADTLLQTMRQYAIWRENLPTQLRDDVEQSEGSAQRDAIESAIEYTQISVSKRSSLKLTDDTIEAIYVALQQILEQRIQELDPETRASVDRFKGDANAEMFMLSRIVFRGMRFGGWSSRGSSGGDGVVERLSPLREQDELQMVRWVLPVRAVEILDLVANGDPILESITLRTWTEETLRRKWPRRRDEISDLERYLLISQEDRERIDLLPPDRFLRELGRAPVPR
ncbi:MAG: hypothetical protein P8L85_04630 [Rubripirellula sp.]|nr:hypothetical protein [Rubripirellula sp.]